MRLVGQAALFCFAGILLVIAVPFGLVQLDLIPAAWLRLTPTAIALVIAGSLIGAALAYRRQAAKDDRK